MAFTVTVVRHWLRLFHSPPFSHRLDYDRRLALVDGLLMSNPQAVEAVELLTAHEAIRFHSIPYLAPALFYLLLIEGDKNTYTKGKISQP